MVKAVAMANVPTQAHAPSPAGTAHLVQRIPMAVPHTLVVVATNLVVTAQSAAPALPRKARRTTMTRNRPSILKMTSSLVPMRIWAPKAASMPLATNPAAAQAVNPIPP